MKYFKKLDNLPTFDLYNEFKKLNIDWYQNQVCINTVPNAEGDYKLGCGSLQYNWEEAETRVNNSGEEYTHVPEYDVKYTEKDFTVLCSLFVDTLFESVYNSITKEYNIGRLRLMKSKPKTCLSWHKDTSPRLHFPVKTQEGCIMVIEDECFHIPNNEWYWTNTTVKHTAFNGSFEDRIHLVATILEEEK